MINQEGVHSVWVGLGLQKVRGRVLRPQKFPFIAIYSHQNGSNRFLMQDAKTLTSWAQAWVHLRLPGCWLRCQYSVGQDELDRFREEKFVLLGLAASDSMGWVDVSVGGYMRLASRYRATSHSTMSSQDAPHASRYTSPNP